MSLAVGSKQARRARMRQTRTGEAGPLFIAAGLLLCLPSCAPGEVSDAMNGGPAGQLGSSQTTADVQLTAAADPVGPSADGSRYEATAGSPALGLPSTQSEMQRPASSLAQRVYGVTIDDVSPLYDLSQALAGLAKQPTARVIFDPLRAPTSYQSALRKLSGVSYVMGDLLDSVAVSAFSPEAYETRAGAYVDQLGDLVDIWEIGSEVNGEWVGEAREVATKVERAYTQVATRGKPSALTLYYNEGCVQKPENEIFTWAKSLSEGTRRGLDYVFITYYQERCHHPEPDWKSVFSRLREIFPYAKLGFGGCGTTDEARKAELVQHFYGLQVDVPGFVGGYFWWYFRQDMQPAGTPLWNVLNQSLETVPL